MQVDAHFRDLLRRASTHLGLDGDAADQVVDTRCLRFAGVSFALHLDEATQQLEVRGDCGLPDAWQEEPALHRHLLHQSLEEDIPGLAFGLHPVSGHVVARARLFLPAVDDEGWLLTGLLAAATDRILELREKFSFHASENT